MPINLVIFGANEAQLQLLISIIRNSLLDLQELALARL
jgi:hypothetical protein